MKLLNAKEALLFELGDFGVAEDAKDKEDVTKESESGMFEVDEDGNIIGFESVEDDTVAEKDEAQGEEEEARGEQPPDLFESLSDVFVETEGEGTDASGEPSASEEGADTTESDGMVIPPDIEEQRACQEALTDALTDRRMPQETFNWGIDYIRKLGKAQVDNLKSRWAAVDKEAMRQEMDEMESEEEAQENAEKERFLRG